jgi:hypothetical protein
VSDPEKVAPEQVDDELLSAFLDDELTYREREVVARLVQTDPAWGTRLAAFRELSGSLRKLPVRELSDSERALVLERVERHIARGAERRRVPRFRRRWMLIAAMVVPTLFTLFFFQNPHSTCRLYLKVDGLELQAGRSVIEDELKGRKRWASPKLWGRLKANEVAQLSFQVDAKKELDQHVESMVFYDFDGDGEVDRTEVYETVKLDGRIGWERFTPKLAKSEGEYEPFQGGQVAIVLSQPAGEKDTVRLSGTPGELIVPYEGLRTSKGAYDPIVSE